MMSMLLKCLVPIPAQRLFICLWARGPSLQGSEVATDADPVVCLAALFSGLGSERFFPSPVSFGASPPLRGVGLRFCSLCARVRESSRHLAAHAVEM